MEVLSSHAEIAQLPAHKPSGQPGYALSNTITTVNESALTGGETPANASIQEVTEATPEQCTDEAPVVNIAINNVVSTFTTRCHLNLREIALHGDNVEHKKAQGMLNMKLRKPSATASIWSSGKITVTGASSEDNSKVASRRMARKLQKLGFNVSIGHHQFLSIWAYG